MNTFVQHVAKHKTAYIVVAVLAVIGFSALSYIRVPDFKALGLTGDSSNTANGASIQVVAPNGGEVFQRGGQMTIQWALTPGNVTGGGATKVDIYLKKEGTNQKIKVIKNVTGGSYNYTIPSNRVGQWKVMVVNKRLRIIDESDGAFGIQPAPQAASPTQPAQPVQQPTQPGGPTAPANTTTCTDPSQMFCPYYNQCMPTANCIPPQTAPAGQLGPAACQPPLVFCPSTQSCTPVEQCGPMTSGTATSGSSTPPPSSAPASSQPGGPTQPAPGSSNTGSYPGGQTGPAPTNACAPDQIFCSYTNQCTATADCIPPQTAPANTTSCTDPSQMFCPYYNQCMPTANCIPPQTAPVGQSGPAACQPPLVFCPSTQSCTPVEQCGPMQTSGPTPPSGSPESMPPPSACPAGMVQCSGTYACVYTPDQCSTPPAQPTSPAASTAPVPIAAPGHLTFNTAYGNAALSNDLSTLWQSSVMAYGENVRLNELHFNVTVQLLDPSDTVSGYELHINNQFVARSDSPDFTGLNYELPQSPTNFMLKVTVNGVNHVGEYIETRLYANGVQAVGVSSGQTIIAEGEGVSTSVVRVDY